MKIYGRQGDLVVEKFAQPISGDLVERQSIVFAGDSSGHRHRLLGPALVVAATGGRITRFRLVEPTELVHEKADGHKALAMAPGDYEIRPLRERGDAGDRAVED